MKTPVILICLLLLACATLFPGCTAPPQKDLPPALGQPAGSTAPALRGQFVFNDSLGNFDRPITVYTYQPSSWEPDGPVLILPGRSGESAISTWAQYGDRYSCLLVAPEFSEQYYPGDLWYIGGYLYDMTGKANPKSKWTYSAIEHIFDEVRKKTGARSNSYLLFGHSANGQFVHRLVTFLPEGRYSRAVAANPGFFVFPTYSVQYPTGLKDSLLPASDLPKVLGRKLIIMSGTADTNANDSSLASFPAAEAEGKNRFERALAYYNSAKTEAARLSIPLNWEYHTVPGVGHDEGGMARASAVFLFNGS